MNVPEINLTTMNSAQVREAYIEAADTLQARWKQAKVGESYDTTRIEGLDGTTPVECNEEMAAYNKHVIALKTELDVRNAAEDAAKQGAIAQHAQAMPFGGQPLMQPRQTLAQMIEASPVFQALQARQTLDGSHVLLHEDQTREWMNTLFTTTAGFPPPQIRQGPVELSPQQGPTMLDVVPQVASAEDSSYRYMLESTFATTNVAPKTEGSAAGEVRIAYTEQTAPIQWIPVTLPVTIQDLQDVAGLQFLLESRLRFMIEQELDKQILTGNGTAPNLTGTLNVTGIQTEAKASTEDIFDEIYKVFVDIMSDGQATPDTIVLNPNNWQTLRTKKDTDGNYLYGPPYLAGDLPVWGANKVITSHMTANTAAVGAYRQHSVLAIRGGIEIAVTDSHAAEFISGINRIRVSLRAAMVHRRPKAFGTITTLNT